MWRERGASDEVGSLKQFELKLYSQVKPVTYIRSALLLDDNTFIHSECQDTSAIQTELARSLVVSPVAFLYFQRYLIFCKQNLLVTYDDSSTVGQTAVNLSLLPTAVPRRYPGIAELHESCNSRDSAVF